jgi:bifunctional DNA-binding transcriptional regulator/antitoxin component of YhaV-PrlF toxin-antitoxin module
MPHTFDAEIQSAGGGGAYVTVPFDVREAFGTARPKIVATFDGHPYRGLISPMSGCSLIVVRKEIRAAIGKQPGDTVRVTVEADAAPREVEVPADLADALAAHPEAGERFGRMSYTHRKEYVAWIEEARKEETRARRVEKAVGMIAEGRPQRP